MCIHLSGSGSNVASSGAVPPMRSPVPAVVGAGVSSEQVDSARIPAKKGAMSQRVTKEIERNNRPNRHWVARCKRQSMVVSKSLEMVELTMALSAKFHVNGDDSCLLQSLQI